MPDLGSLYSATMRRLYRSALLTFSCAAVVAACGGSETTGPDGNNSSAPTLSTLALAIDLQSIPVGTDIQPVVTGRYSDGTEADLSAEVTWTSNNPSVVEVLTDPANTLRAVGEGAATLTASLGDVSGTIDVMIEPAKVVELELIPDSGSFGYGGFLTLEVISVKSDGTRDQVTSMVEWDSSRTNVAIPSAQEKGRLISFGQGTTTITATYEGISVSGEYTVTEPQVEYMQISPQNVRVTYDQPVQFTATAVYSDHDPQGVSHIEDVTSQVTWESSDEAILVIDENGLGTAIGDGEIIVTATAQSGVSVSTIARTVSIACPYPENPSDGINYDTVAPPLFWLDAYMQDGSTTDLLLEQAYCNAEQVSSILFVIGAGWCPYCPDYMRAVNDVTPQIEEAGGMVVYVEIETSGGAPANNMQANSIVDHEVTMPLGTSYRVGDGATQGANMPFSRAVSAIPSAFVVRTSDMRVIASQARSGSRLDWVSIARDPSRLY